MSGWQPIGSGNLPREYECILVARDTGKVCAMPGFWDGEHWRAFSLAGTLIFRSATHWQPLPPPPHPVHNLTPEDIRTCSQAELEARGLA